MHRDRRGTLFVIVLTALLLGARGPVDRIDRMWVVGAPALDGAPKAGVYAWLDRGALTFAVAPRGDGRPRVYQWTVEGRGLALDEGGDCKVAAKSARALVLAARPVRGVARCRVSVEGEIALSRFRVGRRAAEAFVGPRARPAARRIRIGRYGRKAR